MLAVPLLACPIAAIVAPSRAVSPGCNAAEAGLQQALWLDGWQSEQEETSFRTGGNPARLALARATRLRGGWGGPAARFALRQPATTVASATASPLLHHSGLALAQGSLSVPATTGGGGGRGRGGVCPVAAVAARPAGRQRRSRQPLSLAAAGGGPVAAATALVSQLSRLPAGLILAITIMLEVFATTCMKMAATGGKGWYFGVYLGYICCFSLFPLALRSLSLSVAYATWSGAGTAASVLLGVMLFSEKLTKLKLLYIALIIGGVVGLNF